MSLQSFLSDHQLRERVIILVQQARNQLPPSPSHVDIQQIFKIQIHFDRLPVDKDGVYIENDRKIVINRDVSSEERRRFTLYHELVHHLIREEADLYSYLHDTYEDTKVFDKTIENICNIGAAEIILPRDQVRELINREGFSLNLVPQICQQGCVSGPAAIIQLVQCAPNQCYGVVCEFGISPIKNNHDQKSLFHTNESGNLFILYAIWSPSTKYPLSRWTLIPHNHILAEAADKMEFIKGIDRIPFRSGTEWFVPCQALKFRNSVYGLFYVTPPTNSQQLPLF